MATKHKLSHHSSSKLKKKKFSRRQLSVFILVFALVGGILIYFSFAASLPPPSIYLSPSSGSLNNGDNITVDVYEDSGADPVNVAQVNLTYSTSQLSYTGYSDSTVWHSDAQNPGGDTGTLNFARFPTCASSCPSVTGNNLVVSITFKVVGSGGTADIHLASGTSLVRADNNQYESPLALGDASFSIASAPSGDTTPPSAPGNLKASAASSSSISLSWAASTDNVGVAHYDIYRGTAKVTSTGSTSYTDSGLASSTSYSYHVIAVDAAGNQSASSNTASATTNATAASGGTGGGTTTRSSGGTTSHYTPPSSTPVTTPTTSGQPVATDQPASPQTAEPSADNPAGDFGISKIQLKPLILGTLGAIGLAIVGIGALQLSSWLSARAPLKHHIFASGAPGGPAPIIMNPGVTAPPAAQSASKPVKPTVAGPPAAEQMVNGKDGAMIKPSTSKK